jgi:hypothetical protein
VAGLRLYALTAEMLTGSLQARDEPLVASTVHLIRRALADTMP